MIRLFLVYGWSDKIFDLELLEHFHSSCIVFTG
jgi:hypothetical protein